MNNPSGITSLIHTAWIHRFSGEISIAKDLLLKIESQLSTTPESIPQHVSETLLLKVSLLRHDLDLNQAHQTLDLARQTLHKANIADSFQVQMQTALCLLAESKQSEGLRFLKKAELLAQGDFETLLAKINTLIVLFNLNLPHDSLLQEISSIDLKDHPLRGIFEQIQMISLKKLYHRGEIDWIYDNESTKLNQIYYFKSFVASLPWMVSADSTKLIKNFIDDSLHHKELFQQDYRLQTILADPRHQDFDLKNSSFFSLRVDRIYLWTWKWIENPESILGSLLEKEMADFPFAQASKNWTDEDFLLLESALGWLGLFNERFSREAQAWLSKVRPLQVTPSDFFDLDRKIRDYLSNRKSPVDLLKEFNSFAKSDNNLFSLYVGYIQILWNKNQTLTVPSSARLLVNVAASTLTSAEKTLISPTVAPVLQLLKKQNTVEFSEALLAGYQIPQYDSAIHGPKINNLVQRMKTILPPMAELKTKNQKIYLFDPSNSIQIELGRRQEAYFPKIQIPTEAQVKRQTEQNTQESETYLRAKLYQSFKQGVYFSRQDIQRQLCLSKPTANRLIEKWLKNQVLIKKGSGPTVIYTMT